ASNEGKPRHEPGKAHDQSTGHPELGEIVVPEPPVRFVIGAEDYLQLGPDVVTENLHARHAEERLRLDVAGKRELRQPAGQPLQGSVQSVAALSLIGDE